MRRSLLFILFPSLLGGIEAVPTEGAGAPTKTEDLQGVTNGVTRSYQVRRRQVDGWIEDIHANIESDSLCRNLRPDSQCEFWKAHGSCTQHVNRMREWCKRTCNYCDGVCLDYSDQCPFLAGHGACHTHPHRMKKMCSKMCGFCQTGNQRLALSPPSCAFSRYGCCWNQVTSALSPDGQGCPVCVDQLRLCSSFKHDCHMDNSNIQFLRSWCPRSCGRCKDGLSPTEVPPDYAQFWDNYLQERMQTKPQDVHSPRMDENENSVAKQVHPIPGTAGNQKRKKFDKSKKSKNLSHSHVENRSQENVGGNDDPRRNRNKDGSGLRVEHSVYEHSDSDGIDQAGASTRLVGSHEKHKFWGSFQTLVDIKEKKTL